MTTATNEGSFSALEDFKTYLRSTMTEWLLNGLAMLFVHKHWLSIGRPSSTSLPLVTAAWLSSSYLLRNDTTPPAWDEREEQSTEQGSGGEPAADAPTEEDDLNAACSFAFHMRVLIDPVR